MAYVACHHLSQIIIANVFSSLQVRVLIFDYLTLRDVRGYNAFMSTKSSLLYVRDRMHLYTDFMDEESTVEAPAAIYLELSGDDVQFDASQNSVCVRIPVELWELARQQTVCKFDLVDAPDGYLLIMAERYVDDILKARESPDGPLKGLHALWLGEGSTRAEWVTNAFTKYHNQREYQRNLKNKIASLGAGA